MTSPEKKGMNYNEIEKLHHQVECEEEEEEITIIERSRPVSDRFLDSSKQLILVLDFLRYLIADYTNAKS